MSATEASKNEVAFRRAFKGLREKFCALKKEKERLTRNCMKVRDADYLKISSLKYDLGYARQELFWSKYSGQRLRELMRKINKARGDYACGCVCCDRYERHPGVHKSGYKHEPCTFVPFFQEYVQTNLGLSLYVLGPNEAVQLCSHALLGCYSDLGYHLVASHDWSVVYYGSRIADKAESVDTEPIQEVLDIFDIPAMLYGIAPQSD